MKKKTLREVKFTSGLVIPAGTILELNLAENAIRTEYNGKRVRFGYTNAHANFGAPFTKPPTNATVLRWDRDGKAKTVTGQWTDPDGYCEKDGPSWLKVLGML